MNTHLCSIRIFYIERKTCKEIIIKFSLWTNDGGGKKIQNNNNKYDHVNVAFGALFFSTARFPFRNLHIYVLCIYYRHTPNNKGFFLHESKDQFIKNTI